MGHDQDVMVSLARSLATAAHRGQVDKAGAPYIAHPARVAARLDAPMEQATAWLHDVIEDTAVTLDDLRAAGVPPRVVDAVEVLTRERGEDPQRYYARVAADELALRVKRADIADNADERRLAALDRATGDRLRAKYAHALDTLQRLEAENHCGATSVDSVPIGR